MVKRNHLFILLSILFTLCMIFSFAFISTTNLVQGDSLSLADITLKQGASVRINEKSGIRFSVKVSDTLYNSLVKNGQFIDSDDEIGMIIVPYSYVEDFKAYKNANPTSNYTYYEFFRNVKGKLQYFTYTPEQITANPVAGGYMINGALVDIKAENLERDFVAIGFFKTNNVYTYTEIVEKDNARNIVEVSTKAIEDKNSSLSSEQIEQLSNLYNIEYHTVTYENAGKNVEYYVNNAYGTNYVFPDSLSEEGYNFKGYSALKNDSSYVLDGGKLTDNIVVKANWTMDIDYDDIPNDYTKPIPATLIAHTWTADEISNIDIRYSNLTYSRIADGNTATTSWAFDWQGRVKGFGTGFASIKLPLINYNDYSSVYFYMYCNNGSRVITTGGSDWRDRYTVGTVSNTEDTYEQYGIFTIKNSKLYFRLNTANSDTEVCSLTNAMLSGTESIVISFRDGNGQNITISDLYYDGFVYDKDMSGVNRIDWNAQKIAHTWTEDDISNIDIRYSNLSYSRIADGNKATGNWAFDWQGRVKGSGTGLASIKLPLINYNDYSSVYFYMYCNWGYRIITTGGSSWRDQYTVGTVKNIGDTYNQYGIITIKNSKLYFRLNAVSSDTEVCSLTDAMLSGTESIVISFKDGGGQNITISDLYYDVSHSWKEGDISNIDIRYSNLTYSIIKDGNKATTNWAFDWQGRVKGSGTGYASIKLPLINYSDYLSVYFYMYCNNGSRVITTGGSDWRDRYTVGTVSNSGDTYEQYGIFTIKNSKLYFRLNTDSSNTEVCSLTNEMLSGTEPIVISFKDGGGANITISDLYYGVSHSWKEGDISNIDDIRYTGGVTYSIIKDGNKATTNWAFDWQGRVQGSGTSYTSIKLPLINYSDYLSVYFYMYCNWGSRLLKTGGSSNYDQYTVGTVSNTQDTYNQYGIITIKNSKLYFRLNTASSDTEVCSLTDAMLSGKEPIVISFKDGGGQNITISDLYYVYKYEIDFFSAIDELAKKVDSSDTNSLKLLNLQNYNYYKSLVENNKFIVDDYNESSDIQEYKNSIENVTVLTSSINNIEVSTLLSNNKKVTAGTANTDTTWYNNQSNGNNIGIYVELQVLEDLTLDSGFKKSASENNNLNYTIKLPVINFKNYCEVYGSVNFKITGSGFALYYYGTLINPFATSVDLIITISDRKLFVNNIFVSLIEDTAFYGTNSLEFNIIRGKSNTFGWISLGDITTNVSFVGDAIGRMVSPINCMTNNLIESISESEITGFNQTLPNLVNVKKDLTNIEALFFSSSTANDSSFRFNKSKKVKIVSFDYIIYSNSSTFNTTIDYLGSSNNSFKKELIADGKWRTIEIYGVDNNFGGFIVTLNNFVGSIFIANVNIVENDILTVSFLNSNVPNASVYYGESVSSPIFTPQKGYNFVRWDTLQGEAYNFNSPVTSNLSLVARYTVYGPSGDKQTILSWKDAVSLTAFGDWNNANISDWTGTTGLKQQVPAKNSTVFTLPAIDFRNYDTVSFKVTLNWANLTFKYNSTTLLTLNANGGTYVNPIDIYIVGRTIKCGNVSLQLTDNEYKGRSSIQLKAENSTNSTGNVIFSHFVSYICDYRDMAENYSVELTGSETKYELFNYISVYNSYIKFYTAYELENIIEPDCITNIKERLANEFIRLYDNNNNANGIPVTYTDSINGEQTITRSSGAESTFSEKNLNGNKYNIQKTDSKTGATILDYVVTLPKNNFKELNLDYNYIYFGIGGGNSQKITLSAFDTTIFVGTTGKEVAYIIICDGKLYVNGTYKVDVPDNVYTGADPLVVNVHREESDTYCAIWVSDIAGAATYSGLTYAGKNNSSDNYNPTEGTVTLVSNGLTDYVVYYSEPSGSYETNSFDRQVLGVAVNDFVRFFGEATGATISTTTSNTNEFNCNDKSIVIGKLSESANLDYSGLTTDTGYKIVREGNSIFIYGKTVNGTSNGVYAFLNMYFNYEFFTDECYTFTPTNEVKISSLDIVFNPDIDYVLASGSTTCGSDYNDATYPFEYQYRLGYVTDHYVTGGSTHNFLTLISKETYGAEHPNWFTEENWYSASDWYQGKPRSGASARGTFTTLNLSYNNYEMVPTVAELIASSVNASNWNGRKFFTFSQPDRLGWSTASSSQAVMNQYGVYSAEYILFMNKLAKYLDDNYDFADEVVLQILAYGAIVEAPEFSNDLKLYSGNKVKVGVMFAPIEKNNMLALEDSSIKGVVNDQYNSYYAEQLRKWKALAVDSNEVGYWNYSTYFDNYLTPFDSIINMQTDYKLLKSLGVNVLKDQGQIGNHITTSPDWDTLKNYLKVKLARNVNEDVQALIVAFCDAYYGSASSYMQQLLKTESDWLNGTLKDRAVDDGKSNIGLSQGASWLNNSGNKKYWDEGNKKWYSSSYTYDASMLKSWYGNISNALTSVSGNTTLENRIKVEGLSIRYLLARVYGDTTYGTISQIISDAQNLGIRYFGEGKTITSLT